MPFRRVMEVNFSRFDHSKTGFPLTRCSCSHEVHRLPQTAEFNQLRLINTNFKAAPTKCEACHADVHGVQFAKAGVTACAACHDSTKWKPSLFDHDKETAFALQGAHRNVALRGLSQIDATG